MSKLNPHAGEFIPSFATGPIQEPKNLSSTIISYPINYLLQFRDIFCQLPQETLPDFLRPPRDLVQNLSDKIVYTPEYLLKFQPLYTNCPDTLVNSAVFEMFSTTKLHRTRSRKSKEKREQRNQYVDENFCIPRPIHQIVATDNPDKEAAEAVIALNKILDDIPSTTSSAQIELVDKIPVTCSTTLYAITEVIFDRAIAEVTFSSFYVQLCVHLSEKMPEFKDGVRTVNLRRILLTKCYEALVEDPQGDEVDCSGFSWRKQCMISNVRFIGELFRRKLLTENVMHVCIAMMLEQENETALEVIEAVCQLIILVGDILDSSTPASRRSMAEYFQVLEQLSTKQQLPLDLRHLIEQTIGMRSNGWIMKDNNLKDSVKKTVDASNRNKVDRE